MNSDGTTSEEWTPHSVGLYKFNADKAYVVTISRNGVGKKTPVSEYKKLQKLCKLKEGDKLAYVFSANDEDNILIRSQDNKICKVKVADIKLSGKLTIGVKIVGFVIADACLTNDYFYTINADNQVKRCEVGDLTRSTVGLNDGCTHIGSCDPHTVYWSRGKFTPFDWNKVSVKSRTSDGAKISNSEIRVY